MRDLIIDELIIDENTITDAIDDVFIEYKNNELKLLKDTIKLTINLPNLKILRCGYNKLRELNINNSLQLEKIYCYNNELTELNINNLYNLDLIECYSNSLKLLYVNNLKLIDYININNNTIIICKNENLQQLYKSKNNKYLIYNSLDEYLKK